MQGNISFSGDLSGAITGEGGGSIPVITATAQVDSNTGSPSVNVTRTGTDKNVNFNFSFHNLKGSTGSQGPAGQNGTDGIDGSDGVDGVSPTIFITNITGGHRVKIIDADHPLGQSFDVMDGENGVDGVSPAITITDITGGHRVTITDADHPSGQTFDVMDGVDGSDGVSPEVTIGTITGGHSVTITDADHPSGQTFNVMDGSAGSQGPAGEGVPEGGNVGQYLRKNGSMDYMSEWADIPADEVVYDNTSSGLSAVDVQAAIDENAGDISTLNSSLAQLNDSNLHSLTSESASVVINRGGYLQLGDMVIVSVKITLSATVGASTKILSGFPAVNDGFALPMMSLNHTDSLRMSLSNAYTNQSTTSGEYWITGAYITY